ncbi:MAG: inorganic pyrophosphatase [Ignavibacteriae bacterium]|nr:inorganic pyrophosphatase [Ignavibacteriota bacterium]MCB9205764.1 inorganic pyrophosphatase [Ignavibacteriales bacterium]MCB9209926.1 inorganic pyrophosphatase [Ignavibacteriales bacterium]MCB9219359.1 inorganic pyrophosphatase [Ignavibacteriales bacterium]MCB9260246.1 inorganic pyrophosphatase [Ignavibacteriales bacterium]
MSFPTPFFKWRPHPWHGLDVGKNPPHIVNAYIEITPFDFIKYEVEKTTGYLRVDRPHRTSSQPPSLYGFIPKTYCGDRVRDLSPNSKKGDGDPLDICIISERPINKSEIILGAKVVGGIQMVDHKEADDKIIAVLENDNVWQSAEDIKDLPSVMIERLRHYFLTYKLIPGEKSKVQIDSIYDREHALKVVKASILDYEDEYGS